MQDTSIPKIPLKNIYFGNVDVTDEINHKNFIELYYDKDSISETITTDNIFLIAGRKGTGKSYFANYLREISKQGNKLVCRICDQDNYNIEKISKLKAGTLGKDQSTLLWKWIIYSQFAEMIFERHKLKKNIPFTAVNNLHNLYKKLNKRLDVIYKPTGKTITSSSKYGGALKSGDTALSAHGENQLQNAVQYEIVEYFETVPMFEKLLIRALKKERGFLLLFDDLDELDGATSKNTEYNNSISGLIKTVKEFNSKINAYQHKAIIMLRSDIIRSLMPSCANLNKQIAESNITFNWFEDKNSSKPEEHPLLVMILKKVKATVPEYKDLENAVLYKHLFPEKVNNKDPFSFLLDHSFGRPRDLVAFLNQVKKFEKNNEIHYFSAKSLRGAKKKYSRWFLQELQNEVSIHERKLMVEDGMKLVRNYKKISFKLSEIQEFYDENRNDYPNIIDLREVFSELYKYGFIGNQNGTKSYWGYREDADNEPNFALTFTLHYAIQPTL